MKSHPTIKDTTILLLDLSSDVDDLQIKMLGCAGDQGLGKIF